MKNIACLALCISAVYLTAQSQPQRPKLPCPNDPLVEVKVAPTNVSGKVGGLFGCVRKHSKAACNHGDKTKNHFGIDLMATTGEEIFSMYPGKVVALESRNTNRNRKYNSKLGNYVTILSRTPQESIKITYAHLSTTLVEEGQEISEQTVIGTAGTTGNAWNTRFPHVHIKLEVNDIITDPVSYMTTVIDAEANITSSCNEK